MPYDRHIILAKRLRSPSLTVLGVIALLFGVLIVLTVSRCQGRFVYTLDDPYIHLALARQIARGHFGLNAGEASAPSSSILWPFLLAPFASTPSFEFVPLVVNLVCCAAAACVTASCFAEIVPQDVPYRDRRIVVWTLAVVISANGVGVALSGMEHGLQVLLTVLAALGLIRFYQGGRIAPWFVAALVLAPLIRYENLVLTSAIAAFLGTEKKRLAALAIVLVPIAVMVAFSLFLHRQGLGLLPSSVIAKSESLAKLSGILPRTASGGASFADSLLVKFSVVKNYGFILFIPLVLAFAFPRELGRARRLWLVLAVALLGHFVVGQIGWWQRYEIYLYNFGVVMMAFLRTQGAALALPGSPAVRGLAIGAFFVVFGLQSFVVTALSPLLSWAIYAQQYQMMRFARDFGGADVAVNDLGEVGFGSGRFVLDLWGLASVDALKARLVSGRKYDWAGPIVDAKRIGLVMIYPNWVFPQSASWRPIGVLKRKHVPTVAGDEVTFYATRWADYERLRDGARRFGASLPPGASFELSRP